MCLFDAYFGKQKIDEYVKRTNAASTLVFTLVSFIALSVVGFVGSLFARLQKKQKRSLCLDGFRPCAKHGGGGGGLGREGEGRKKRRRAYDVSFIIHHSSFIICIDFKLDVDGG